MIVSKQEPPRAFQVGQAGATTILDCGKIELAPDEQVTFVTDRGGEYDVVRKDWGFYATPSLNGRLARFGLRAVLTRNEAGRYYICLVERGHEAAFEAYLLRERNAIVAWLDGDEALATMERRLAAGGAP